MSRLVYARFREAAAPALLVVVALVQIGRVHALDQSSWAGVGFGMFATIDNHGSRFVRGTLMDGAGERALPPPAAIDDETFALRVVPSEARARRAAAAWLSGAPAGVHGVRTELWGVALDPGGPTLSARRIVAAEVKRESR